MELSVGQYTGRGPIGALGQLCPLFKGKFQNMYKEWINFLVCYFQDIYLKLNYNKYIK